MLINMVVEKVFEKVFEKVCIDSNIYGVISKLLLKIIKN